MSMETIMFSALKDLVGNRVFPDIAPPTTARPYLTYQQVGGAGINFMDPTVPNKRNSRVQVNVWATTRKEAAELARLVEQTLRLTLSLQTSVLGSFSSDFEPDTQLYGTRQDFSFWTD